WALRSLTLVDREAVARFCDREAQLAAETSDGHRAWVIRDVLPKLSEDRAAAIRGVLMPVRRRTGAPSTSRASATAAGLSAAIVGEGMGGYHRHGAVGLYDALVRLAPDDSMRYPLVDGQGKFGSVDGDAAAAMRYTEARRTAIASEMLADIDKETVNFVDNY